MAERHGETHTSLLTPCSVQWYKIPYTQTHVMQHGVAFQQRVPMIPPKRRDLTWRDGANTSALFTLTCLSITSGTRAHSHVYVNCSHEPQLRGCFGRTQQTASDFMKIMTEYKVNMCPIKGKHNHSHCDPMLAHGQARRSPFKHGTTEL